MPHPKFHGIDRAETDRRTNFAIGALSQAGGAKGVRSRIMQEFDVSHTTAGRIVRRAQNALAIDVPTVAAIERERVRRLLNNMIEANGETDPLRLAAIKTLIDLLGLAAPAKAEVALTTKPIDPIDAYRDDAGMLNRALKLERDLADATAAAVNTGSTDFPRMAVPPPPPSSGGNGNGHAHPGDVQ